MKTSVKVMVFGVLFVLKLFILYLYKRPVMKKIYMMRKPPQECKYEMEVLLVGVLTSG